MDNLYAMSNSELEEMGVTVCPCINTYEETYCGQTYLVCNDCQASANLDWRTDAW